MQTIINPNIIIFLEDLLHNKLPFDTPDEFLYQLEEAILIMKSLNETTRS